MESASHEVNTNNVCTNCTPFRFVVTHLTEVLLDKCLGSTIHSIVFMILEELYVIEPTQLFHKQTKLFNLSKFLSSLGKQKQSA